MFSLLTLLAVQRTLNGRFDRLNIVKQSKFFAKVLGNIKNKEEALAFISEVSEPKASHSCWAFSLSDGYSRFSDDGEPSGAAGKPILLAIEGEEVTNCCVVVVRYFGGTKLGLGGMSRAYSGAARDCIRDAIEQNNNENNNIIELIPKAKVSLVGSYSDAGIIYQLIGESEKRYTLVRLGEESTDSGELKVDINVDLVSDDAIQLLQERCSDLGAGRIKIQVEYDQE